MAHRQVVVLEPYHLVTQKTIGRQRVPKGNDESQLDGTVRHEAIYVNTGRGKS